MMWVGGDAIMFALVLCVFVVFLRDHRAQGTMGDWIESARRQALVDSTTAAGVDAPAATRQRRGDTVDDDDYLAAYNAYLARLDARSRAGQDRAG